MKIELVALPVTEVDEQPWGRFVHFADPDGNAWSLQQMPPTRA
ncbi:VOC family protein [Citricoccus zhacaiensis]